MWLGLPPSTPHPILVLRSPALLKPSTQFIMALRNITDAVASSARFESIIIPLVNGQWDIVDEEYQGNPYSLITAETDEGVGCQVNKSLYDRAKADGYTTKDDWEITIELQGEIKMGKAQFDEYPKYSAKAEAAKAAARVAELRKMQEAAKTPPPPPTETAVQKKAREKREAEQQAVKG